MPAKKKWLKKPAQYGQCRSFQHSWPALGKRKNWLVVKGSHAHTSFQCTICGVIRQSRINLHNGKMESRYMYPKDYLLKRKSKTDRLPTKGDLRKEFIEWVSKS